MRSSFSSRREGDLRRLIAAIALLASGCAAPHAARESAPRALVFERDTLGFANQLYWEYAFDAPDGVPSMRPRQEEVSFGNRCAPMARAIRQFHYAATFEPALPRLSDAEYRERVARVLDTDPRSTERLEPPIVIPGYAGLRSFSLAHESLLKEVLGGRAESFLQRGNLRMVFPFSPDQQRDTAADLLRAAREQRPAIVHLVSFPKTELNHTVVVFAAEETPREIRFLVFDPNHPEVPMPLRFQRAMASFVLPRTDYFAGGTVNAYQIYDGLF